MKWRMIGEIARSEKFRIVERDGLFDVYRHFGFLRNELYAQNLPNLQFAMEYVEYMEETIEKMKIREKEDEERYKAFKKWMSVYT